MKPRLFISHSTAREKIAEDLTPIAEALAAESGEFDGFDVLWDRERLEEGNWKRQLYAWIGLCHGALVLLSKRALQPEKVWVAREANLLMYRKALHPGFAVVPVFRDGEPAEFDTGLFKELGLADLTGLQDDSPAAIAEFIRTKTKLRSPPARTPLDIVTDKVVAKLKHIDSQLLATRAEDMAIDLGAWDPAESEWRRFAVRLLQLPFLEAVEKLRGLVDIGDKTQLEACRDLLAPLNASHEAACCLARILETGPPRVPVLRKAAGLNCSGRETAELFIRRAYWDADSTSIKLAQPTLEGGEGQAASTAQEVIDLAYREIHPPAPGESPKPVTAEQFRSLLLEAEKYGQRVFVLWNCAKQVPFAAVQDGFAPLRIFLLAGAPEPPDWLKGLEGRHTWLEPPLEADEETAISTHLGLARGMI